MYLITAYFDDKTNTILQHHIDTIAEVTGNTYMTDNHVPPHMTLCAFEARSAEVLKPGFEVFAASMKQTELIIASVAFFFPYVMYAALVPSRILTGIPEQIARIYADTEEVSISRFYGVDHWMPHITLAKRLDEGQMQKALEVMRSGFSPITGFITEVGLSEVNPHNDVERIRIK